MGKAFGRTSFVAIPPSAPIPPPVIPPVEEKKEEVEGFVCDNCGRPFKNNRALKTHQRFCT